MEWFVRELEHGGMKLDEYGEVGEKTLSNLSRFRVGSRRTVSLKLAELWKLRRRIFMHCCNLHSVRYSKYSARYFAEADSLKCKFA